MRAAANTDEEKELAELRIQYGLQESAIATSQHVNLHMPRCINACCEILALEGTEPGIFTDDNIEKIFHFLFSFVVKVSCALLIPLSVVGTDQRDRKTMASLMKNETESCPRRCPPFFKCSWSTTPRTYACPPA